MSFEDFRYSYEIGKDIKLHSVAFYPRIHGSFGWLDVVFRLFVFT